jgi:non-canonical poly(A) RNA polymerase PAPD5/7
MAQLPRRFRDLDDLSESESSVEMDIETPDGTIDEEPALKRAKFDDDVNGEAADEKPKWSNPDPYFVLPPMENIGGKKRDVVQLIRKAKLDTTSTTGSSTNAISGNADFVGFDFGDDDDDDDDDEGVIDDGPPIPTGPRADGYRGPRADVVTARLGTVHASPISSSVTNHVAVPQYPGLPIPPPPPLASLPPPPPGLPSRPVANDAPAPDKNRKGQRGLKRKHEEEETGGITSQWLASRSLSATPWLTPDIDHSSTEHMGFW